MNRYTLLFLFSLTAALLVKESNHQWLFPAVMALLAGFDRRSLRILLRWKLWLLLAMLILIPALLVGSKDMVWLGLPCNGRMLRLNLIMVERSLIIMLSVKMFTNHLSPEAISSGLTRMHLRQFDHIFRLSMALLPEIRSMVMNSMKGLNWRQLLLRRGQLFSLLSQLLARILHRAGQITVAQKE